MKLKNKRKYLKYKGLDKSFFCEKGSSLWLEQLNYGYELTNTLFNKKQTYKSHTKLWEEEQKKKGLPKFKIVKEISISKHLNRQWCRLAENNGN
jgi:hypothetical protein